MKKNKHIMISVYYQMLEKYEKYISTISEVKDQINIMICLLS